MGIAVQSRWFHVGQDVAWIEPGVGAVCTQSILEPSYGPLALKLLRHGRSPERALAELTGADEGREGRQVAVMSAEGDVAQHTGAGCVRAAGHAAGGNCCAQANMVARDTCWQAMVDAFESTAGDLVDRLLAALDAAEEDGGDARGRQSAAILVRPGQESGIPWHDRELDLGVGDHEQPVTELRRLVTVHRAYQLLGRSFRLAEAGELEEAVAAVESAQALVPDEDQIAFWRATILQRAGRGDEAGAALSAAAVVHPPWVEFVTRCVEAGLLPPEAEALTAQDS
jgi:uncharacterized Ntn-hydrolase superfamily protein